jgi:hypothetical protein
LSPNDAELLQVEGEFTCSNCYRTAFGDFWCDACETWPCLPATCWDLRVV